MDPVTYVFDGVEREIQVTDGDPDRPLVLLLHGTGGTVSDMTTPAAHPDNNYDFAVPFPPDVTVGWREYPGVGVWSCCDLDPKKDIRSWRDVLRLYKFRTAAYSQVDNAGFLARPVEELGVVMAALVRAFPRTPFVLLAHSRGGLLTRKFLKDAGALAAPVRTVITLHSPHTGSDLASVAVFLRRRIEDLRAIGGDVVLAALGWLLDIVDSEAYAELAVGGDFLLDLAKGEEALPEVDYFTFGGVSVRLTRVRTWTYTLDSAIPQWHWPPFQHRRSEGPAPLVSPLLDTLPDLVDEIADGRGDMLTADARTRLPFAVHQTNRINHAEALWDPILHAQVLRILGVQVPVVEPPTVPTFWE
jgi:Asp-tRNA(Asn)/Glu-tRNA(Gln) amidotransferase A subunit family amidase